MNITCKKVKQKKKLEIILKLWNGRKEKESEDIVHSRENSKSVRWNEKKGKNLDFQKQTCHHIFLS